MEIRTPSLAQESGHRVWRRPRAGGGAAALPSPGLVDNLLAEAVTSKYHRSQQSRRSDMRRRNSCKISPRPGGFFSGGPRRMAAEDLDTDQLLEQARRGDAGARQQLLVRYRQRLRQLIALRMDRRLAARLDPSDVVQETLAEAVQQLSDYLRRGSVPFYPWLRQLALDRLAELHRRHIRT